jgi:hypothetical protein
LDHRGNLRREIRQGCPDVTSGTGPTGSASLASERPLRSAATARGPDRRDGQQFVLDGPAEHRPDPVDVLVDQAAAAARVDHRLADELQRLGPKSPAGVAP